MNLESTQTPEVRMFCVADCMTYKEDVVFVTHKKFESEARIFVSVLALIMRELFGNCIWSWFNTNAKDVIVGYIWDPKKKSFLMMKKYQIILYCRQKKMTFLNILMRRKKLSKQQKK